MQETFKRWMPGLLAYGFILVNLAFSQTSAPELSSSKQSAEQATATDLGVSFVKDSTSQSSWSVKGRSILLISFPTKSAKQEQNQRTFRLPQIRLLQAAPSHQRPVRCLQGRRTIFTGQETILCSAFPPPTAGSSWLVSELHSSLSLPTCLYGAGWRRHSIWFGQLCNSFIRACAMD